MTFPEVWTVPLFTHFCLFTSRFQSTVVKTLLEILSSCVPCWGYFSEETFFREFSCLFFYGIGNLDPIKIHCLCQLISWLKFSKFCEMLIAAPQFWIPTVAAMAGDKSVSFSLHIAVVLSVWSCADDYWVFWEFFHSANSLLCIGFAF